MLFPSDPYLAENAAYRVYSTRKKEAGKFAITHVHVVKCASIGKMNAVFPPWPIREFRDRSDESRIRREDSIFRGAGAFFGCTDSGSIEATPLRGPAYTTSRRPNIFRHCGGRDVLEASGSPTYDSLA